MNEWYMTDLNDLNLSVFKDKEDCFVFGEETDEEFFKLIKDTNQIFFSGFDSTIKKWKKSGTIIPLLIEI